MKKVSIVIPVYNLEKSIGKCLQTVVQQSYQELEILVIDDGSVDNSLSICREYAKTDRRISVFHHDNHGVTYTRNRGISLASGEYLMFIDGDDEILDDCIAQYVAAAEQTEADVVIGGITIVNMDSHEQQVLLPTKIGKLDGKFWEIFCRENTGLYGYVPNKLYRLQCIRENKIQFDLTMFAQEDLDFAISVYNVCNSFACIPYSGYLYYYLGARTNHPYVQYIGNQVKLIRYAQSRCNLSQYAKNGIEEKISGLIGTALYFCKESDFLSVCQQINQIRGLDVILREMDFPSMQIRLFASRHFQILKFLFTSKKRIKRLLRR